VTEAIQRLPDKWSSSDLHPTWVFKLRVHVLAPFLAFLSDQSCIIGTVPTNY
jgi:hypothetical protein